MEGRSRHGELELTLVKSRSTALASAAFSPASPRAPRLSLILPSCTYPGLRCLYHNSPRCVFQLLSHHNPLTLSSLPQFKDHRMIPPWNSDMSFEALTGRSALISGVRFHPLPCYKQGRPGVRSDPFQKIRKDLFRRRVRARRNVELASFPSLPHPSVPFCSSPSL